MEEEDDEGGAGGRVDGGVGGSAGGPATVMAIPAALALMRLGRGPCDEKAARKKVVFVDRQTKIE